MDFKKYGFNETRLEKRSLLIKNDLNPYPYNFEGVQKISDVLDKSMNREAPELSVVIAGRILSKREMGKTIFMDLKDESGKIQLYFRKNNFDDSEWGNILLLDLGDILGIYGTVFLTRTGEITVNVARFSILAKTVVPIPYGKEADEKVYYRTSDSETKYRERYLNWLLNEKDRNRIRLRSDIISSIRQRMEKEGFLEVLTPTIEFVYGGAEARPFRTLIWALGNKEAFLRISPELYLKRYIVAGFDRVFTICQNFRNEGIDHSHNPEFTMMEWYEAFTDYEFQMKRFESLVAGVCEEICGSTIITYQGVKLDFSTPWKRLSVLDALKEYAGIEASEMTIEDLKKEMNKHDIEYKESLSWGLAVTELFETLCEDHLIQPTFITDHPIEISPLTKTKRGDERLVERFEPYVFKMEIGNAYSELTDPVDQLQRLIDQRELNKEDQDYENHPVDGDFVKAIGCGMPPTGGAGLGIDRLVMLLTDAPSIRDIIPFPMIRPKV